MHRPSAGHGSGIPGPSATDRPLISRPRLLVLLGATGTGKSDLACELASELPSEIVGCDAFQVYRGLDAATAKPDAAQRRAVPHHLIDCVDPGQHFTIADFIGLAEAAITEIAARRRTPIIVGGAGYYLRGLLRGLIELPPSDPALRERLRRIASRRGASWMHAWLERVDPGSAQRVARNDLQRIVRGLELARSAEANWSVRLQEQGSWGSAEERYPNLKIGLRMDRERLYRRLDQRVDRFFESGLIDETRGLAARLPPGTNALKALGTREVLAALQEGRPPELEREAVRRNTRRYAKRQETWFRKERGVVWLDAGQPRREIVVRILRLWHGGEENA